MTDTNSVVLGTVNSYGATVGSNLFVLLALQVVVAVAILVVNVRITLQELKGTVDVAGCDVFIFANTVVALALDGLGAVSVD